jgi:hypothetical protein
VFRLEYERTRDREPLLLPPGEGARPPAGEGLQLQWKCGLRPTRISGGPWERWAIT